MLMIKNLLSIAAMALLTLSASAETYDLSVQAGWGASAALPGTTLVANSGWGEFVLATNVSVTDYKGITVGGITPTPCTMFFTEQYGGVELYKADGSKCTWTPASKAEQVYTVTLEEGAPFELLLGADGTDGNGAIYSYPNLVAGEKTVTLTIPADNAKEISGVWLKSAVKPSSASVKIKSITLTETKESQTAITEIEAADENAPVEYFNLQGVRVENPSNGLYIRRQGSKVTKVII